MCSSRSTNYGFEGGMRRWGMAGGPKTHGTTKWHRRFGSSAGGHVRTRTKSVRSPLSFNQRLCGFYEPTDEITGESADVHCAPHTEDTNPSLMASTVCTIKMLRAFRLFIIHTLTLHMQGPIKRGKRMPGVMGNKVTRAVGLRIYRINTKFVNLLFTN